MRRIWPWFLVVMFVMMPQAYGKDVVIDVPPLPSNFPMSFPKYEKCKVNGKRRACYDKRGVKQLLLLWSRYSLIKELPVLTKKQQKLIKKQKDRLGTAKTEITSLRNTKKALKKANEALSKKIKRDEKRARLRFIRDVFIVTGVVIVSVGAGVGIGYAISKL